MAIFSSSKLNVSLLVPSMDSFFRRSDCSILHKLKQKQTRFHKRRKLNSSTLHIGVLDMIIPVSSHVQKEIVLNSTDLHSLYVCENLPQHDASAVDGKLYITF